MSSMNNPKPKRAYDSSRRQMTARQTRRSIIEAARSLFFTKGYEATTIQAIASSAGISVETIYAAFGNKLSILREIVSTSLVGDFEPVPLLERPFIQENIQRKDPHAIIRHFALDIFQIMTRMSPVFFLLRSTARTNPEIATYLSNLLQERRMNMNVFTNALKASTPLREGIDDNLARDSVWALSSAEVFDLLTRDLSWTQEQYVSWLTDSLTRLLLPDSV